MVQSPSEAEEGHFSPPAKNEGAGAVPLARLPQRHAPRNGGEGPLDGTLQTTGSFSHSLSFFSSQNLSSFLGFALNFGLVLEGGGGRPYYLT